MLYLSFDQLSEEYSQLNKETYSYSNFIKTPIINSNSKLKSTELVIATPIILYKVPIPLPGSLGAPYFKGTNITKFLERFEEIYKDYRVEGSSKKLKRLPKYYTIMISRSIKNIIE
jgi:hypothetical protein